MIIGIESGLEDIKRYLDALGKYTIKDLTDCDGKEEVIIYKKLDTQEVFKTYQFDMLNNMLENNNHQSEGILIINANHKTSIEIEELLDARFLD